MEDAKPGPKKKAQRTGGRSRRKAPEPPPIAECRGVVSFDTNEILVFVRAPVEAVAAAFRDLRHLATWVPEAEGQTVTISDPCYIVYRLMGHSWTIIDHYHGRDGYLKPVDAKALSKALGTKALYYGNSDTAGATGYELFENGRRLERFDFYDEVEFKSTLRRVDPSEYESDIYTFVDAFLRAQDAFAPGWSTWLGGWSHKPGQQVPLDFEPDDGDSPRLMERLDFVGA